MKFTIRPHIKICCIQDIEEAKLAIQWGASAIGLVSEMPSGPGVIDDRQIRDIASVIPPPIATFLLTSKVHPDSIIKQHKEALTNVIQFVDSIDPEAYKYMKKMLPAVKFVQVVHVKDRYSVDHATDISGYVDALLLDSGNPGAEIKELGGTGRVHNWDFSREIRDNINIPLFLAGGLNPGNVCEAISKVKPFGVDVCSGVRTEGRLDPDKLDKFVHAVKNKE
jgi:phosphoribosylanthranilate isomerase